MCDLSNDQVRLYRKVIADLEMDLDGLADDTATMPYMNILAAIIRLKQICDHPCLVKGCSNPEEFASGKWDLFVELTAELLAAEMKFVVFSRYVDMLALIERYLQEAGIGFCSLKGDMPVRKRQKMIDEFNTNPACGVFCASLLAGGIGIDLTAAQAVIHYDRWWSCFSFHLFFQDNQRFYNQEKTFVLMRVLHARMAAMVPVWKTFTRAMVRPASASMAV